MINPILLAELNRIMGGALPPGMYGGTQVVGGHITGGGSSGSGGSGTGSSGGSGGTSGSDEADETITKNADGTVTIVSKDSDGAIQTTIEFPNGVKVESLQLPDERIAINVIQPDGTSSTRLLNPDGSLRSTATTDIHGNRTLQGDGYTLTFRADGGASREIHRNDGSVYTRNSNADGSYTTETRGSDGTLLWRRSVDAEGYGKTYQAGPNGLNLTLRIRVREDEAGQEHDEILSGSVDGKDPSSWERATGAVRGLVDWIVDEATASTPRSRARPSRSAQGRARPRTGSCTTRARGRCSTMRTGSGVAPRCSSRSSKPARRFLPLTSRCSPCKNKQQDNDANKEPACEGRLLAF